MSGILPKSRTQAERESYTLDVNSDTAQRVVDVNTHNKLDEVVNAVENITIDVGDITLENVEISNDEGNPIPVNAIDLDIRDLVFATDKVDVTGSEVSLDATTLAALEDIDVTIVGLGESGISTGANQDEQTDLLTSIDTKLTSPITVTGPLTDTELRASAVPISAATLPLPTGASTSALQNTGNVSLSSIDSKLTSPLNVTGPLTDAQLRATAVPVSASTLPLPTGAATAALQTQPGVDIGDVTINNTTGASAVNIQDGGNSLTVDATNLDIRDLVFATDKVDISGSTVTNADRFSSGTISALNGTVIANTQGSSALVLTVTGTWVATLIFEGSANGSNWVTIPAMPPLGVLNSQTTFNGTFIFASGGFPQIRVRASAYVSGTATIEFNSGAGSSLFQVYNLAAANLVASCVQSGTWSNRITDGTLDLLLKNTQAAMSDIAIPVRPIPFHLETYTSSAFSLVPAVSATDIFTITGSATKTIKIKRLIISGTQATAASNNILVLRRSTANTGGTSTAPTRVAFDSTNAAATATVLAYTANPTVGTLVGNVSIVKLFIPSGTSTNPAGRWELFFGDTEQPIVLRGTSQVLAVNLSGVTVGTGSINISITWTEE